MPNVPSPSTLSASGLTTGYRSGQPVVRDLSATFRAGEVTAIVGPNGAGKTTLLRTLLGLMPWVKGSVTLNGEAIYAMPPSRRAGRIAYVAQAPRVAFGFRAGEVLAMGVGRGGRRDEAIRRATRLFDVSSLVESQFSELSAGQRHRIAMARALAQLLARAAPKDGSIARYILADEPVGPLDPVAAVATLKALRNVACEEQIGVVLVMHDLSLARRFSDEAVLIAAGGSLVGQGLVADLLTPARLAPVFGGPFIELRSDVADALAIAASDSGR